MIIKDKNENILAFFIFGNDILEGKNFVTKDESQFQLASFLLNKDEVIEKHFHPNQHRNIKNTSEVLVLLDGSIEVTIYDDNLELVASQIINSGDTVALMSGGHGLKLLEESKFIEVKQGPYDEKTDKVRF
jgi:cupin fold WbuC family metalloprotein